MIFKPGFTPVQPKSSDDLWFIIMNGQLMVKLDQSGYTIPLYSDIEEIEDQLTKVQHLGTLEGTPCYAAEFSDEQAFMEGLMFSSIRRLFGILDKQVTLAAGCASQLIRWSQTHQFCGGCGEPLSDKTDERAKSCEKCNVLYYPRLSPAVIVAVLKDDEILLARSGRFPGNMYSVLAGFVEPGETLEECVAREVFEEVGIKVKNIKYFGSQPWPFPDSLMLGFIAEYESGDILVDQKEIVEAKWFAADTLPNIPGSISIARQLIDWYVAQQSD